MNEDVTTLKNKTRYKMVQMRCEYVKLLKKEILSLLEAEELWNLPAISVLEALDKQYMEESLQVIGKNTKCKQKVSIKVGERNMSIGEYDSKEDGDLLEFVSAKYPKKGYK